LEAVRSEGEASAVQFCNIDAGVLGMVEVLAACC